MTASDGAGQALAPRELPLARSEFLRVRGLRYHLRRWGDETRPAILLLHGWLDVSATFAPVVQHWLDRWQVIAPDWRGLGYTEWAPGGYWFHDYLADLDVLFDHYAAQTPLALVGHSMGAQAASLYAGLRPERVSRLVCMDGLFLPDMPPERAPQRVLAWLDQLRKPLPHKTYDSYEALAQRVRHTHPQLDEARAGFIARCWGRPGRDGRIELCADPRHRLSGPGLYRSAESMAVWRQVRAPTLFVDGETSQFRKAIDAAECGRRRACFADHRTVVIDGAGHMLHFDAPQETARAVSDFLGEAEQ